MATRQPIHLPRQWSQHIKSGILHAISLASVALTAAQVRVARRHALRSQLDQANNEIALLREELAIKDGRWGRSRTRRRPHYAPTHRLRILQLRAARGWTLEKTAHVFLLNLHTLQLWMHRVDEHGERELIQTRRPVNRYPDFVRNLVRQLKRLFPAMGSERIAQILARVGLLLAASTIRRMAREPYGPPSRHADAAPRVRRRAVGRHPGDVWHLDLTAAPTRAGFWVPSFPFSLPQRWPYCWWVAVIIDQVSRSLLAFAIFRKLPTSEQMQTFLNRAIRKQGSPPRCIVTDKGPQFTARSYRRWCKRRKIRLRFGYLGEPCSIPIVERFIRSMKQECLWRIVVPLTSGAVRRELVYFAEGFNAHRPHSHLGGRTPSEFRAKKPPCARIETRSRWPHRSRNRLSGKRLALDVRYVAGRKHLPVIALRRAA